MSLTAATQQNSSTKFQAIYTINKFAKRLAKNISHGTIQQQFVTEDCETAQRMQKNALYQVKRQVLEQVYPEATNIEVHTIRGSEYYCFYFGSWSFHSPVTEFTESVEVDGHLNLQDFDTSCATTRTQMSLEDALSYIQTAFDIDVNDELSQRHLVASDGEFVDIGWTTLDE